MSLFDDFKKYDKPISDPVFDRQVKEMQTFLQQMKEEGKRMEFRVSTLSAREKEVTVAEQKIAHLSIEEQHKLNTLKQLDKNIKVAKEQLADIENTVDIRRQELATFTNLSEQISELETKKKKIESLIASNIESESTAIMLAREVLYFRQELSKLKEKRDALLKEIVEKEDVSRKFDRDLEEPKKILEEAKTLEQVGKSSLEAAQKIKEQIENTQGTIGWYIKRLQKKYPHIDFML